MLHVNSDVYRDNTRHEKFPWLTVRTGAALHRRMREIEMDEEVEALLVGLTHDYLGESRKYFTSET
jgi:hypothetical protein